MSSRSAAVRDPSDPSAKHFCQPTRAQPAGSLAEDGPAAKTALDGRRDAVVAHAGMDAQRQVARVGEPGIDRVGVRQVGVGRHAARVVAGDDAERDEAPTHGLDGGGEVVLASAAGRGS